MNSEDAYLRGRVSETVSNLSDEDLVRMLQAPSEQYTPFALDAARTELRKRGGKEAIEKRIAEEVGAYPRFPNPWNYLVWPILVTLFCFFPTGIVAIVYAVLAKEEFDKGNYDAGTKKLQKSKSWCLASVVLTLALVIISLAVLLLVSLAQRTDSGSLIGLPAWSRPCDDLTTAFIIA